MQPSAVRVSFDHECLRIIAQHLLGNAAEIEECSLKADDERLGTLVVGELNEGNSGNSNSAANARSLAEETFHVVAPRSWRASVDPQAFRSRSATLLPELTECYAGTPEVA
jgi:hypothetical protein